MLIWGVVLDEIEFQPAVDLALDAIFSSRLALLCGAGLSMGSPSSIPGAAAIAATAKQRYDARYGTTRAPLSPNIEEQAEFFYARGELGSVYIRGLIDRNTFAKPYNKGHEAIADLLIVGGAEAAVTTNVDSLVEAAGTFQYGQVGVCTTRTEALSLAPDQRPLLKIHGCWSRGSEQTVWAPSQATSAPLQQQLADAAQWLEHEIANCDLFVVGYYTDWDYLNTALERALSEVAPARVVVVNPDTTANLLTKAPVLSDLGGRTAGQFLHVRAYGDVFLDAVRLQFSKSFVRQVLTGGAPSFTQATGAIPASLEPEDASSAEYWSIRRDMEGCASNIPASLKTPPDEPMLGYFLLRLRAAGAVLSGTHWVHNGRRVRVIRSPNKFLHDVVAEHTSEPSTLIAPDYVVAVGAEDSPLLSHVVRGASSVGSFVRGSAARWMTRTQAEGAMGI